MAYKPGQSGNPGGQPKWLSEVRELARGHAVECIEGLMEIARDPEQPGAARTAAYNSVLDRALGKPKQAVEMSGEDGAQLVLQIVTGVPRAVED